MKRAGAVVAAVAMVVAALFMRGTFTDESGNEGGGPGRASAPGLLCPTDLDMICAAADPRIEAASIGAAADALIETSDARELGAEAWIVPAAWARMVVAERQRLGSAPIFEVLEQPIASSSVMIAIWADKADALTQECGDPDWRCLAEHVGEVVDGSRLRVGGPDVDTTSGLTVAASQAAGLLRATDFAANDFGADDFRTLVSRLAAGQRGDPLDAMRSRGPGELTAVGVLTVDAQNLSSSFGAIVPYVDQVPPVRADIVALVPTGEDLDADVRAALTDAFVEAGWDQPARGPDGLPAGGVLAAIRTLWNDSR